MIYRIEYTWFRPCTGICSDNNLSIGRSEALNKMEHLMRKMIVAITILSVISSSVVQASGCDNPLDSQKNGMKGKVNFQKVIRSVKEALLKTNITDIELNLSTGDYCTRDVNCYVEFKVTKNKSLRICVISSNERKCIEITCDCKDRRRKNGLNSSLVNLDCTVQTKNDLQKHTSCQNNWTVNSTKVKHSSEYKQDWTSLKAENFSNEHTTVTNSPTLLSGKPGAFEDGLPWFTTGAFLVGVVCGMIISMIISYICNERKKMKVQKKKSALSRGHDIPLISTDMTDTPVYSEIPEQKQHDILRKPNNDNTQYSSPVYVGEYLEPVKRNGNTTPRQDNQSSAAHVSDIPKHAIPTETSFANKTEDVSDPYNHLYSHLQPNFESQHRLQEKKEHYSKSSETDTSMSNRIKKELDDDPEGISENTADNINIDVQEKQTRDSEIGSYSACISFDLSNFSEKEENDIRSDVQLQSHSKENEYFVLEKNEP